MKRKKKKTTPTKFLLLPRLSYMGYSLLLCSVCLFVYALTSSPSIDTPPLSSLPEEELSALAEISPYDAFNVFAISSIFAALGALCLITSKKKLQSIKQKK